MDKRLTTNEEKFLQRMLLLDSQRVAYKIAYPHSCKWKDKTVDERASRLFNKDKIQARWNELQDKAIKQIEEEGIFTKKQVLQEIKDLLDTKITDIAEIVTEEVIERDEEGKKCYNSDGKPLLDVKQYLRIKDTNEMSEAALKSISEIGHNRYGLYIKRYDKQKTIDQAGRHLNLFTDKLEIDATIKMPGIKITK